MPRQLKASVSFLFTEVRRTVIIFWSILLALLLLTLILNTVFFQEGTILFEISFPMYAFAAIMGQLIVRSSLPYLIKMGSTRLNVFKSVGVYFFGLSLFNAVLANTIQSVTLFLFGSSSANSEPFMTITREGDQVISFSHFADFFQNMWWTRVVVDTSIMFFLLASGFILGLIFYRYGVVGGVSFIALIMFIIILGISKGWLIEFFITIFTNISVVFFVQLLLIGLIIYLFSYLLLRRLSLAQ